MWIHDSTLPTRPPTPTTSKQRALGWERSHSSTHRHESYGVCSTPISYWIGLRRYGVSNAVASAAPVDSGL